MTTAFKRSAIATLVAMAVSPLSHAAGDNSSPANIEQIVITGSPSGKAVRKVDASYAITNISEDDIKKLAPKSTADLFKAVPGVWVESSGGVAGANVFVRGFPGNGDAPFLTVQVQGSPVFPPPTLSFLENSTLFRLDETVSFMEALRGGPNPVVSNGQPGLTTNFLLKEGSEETEGLVKYTTSDYDLQRVDAVLSGALGDGLYYMVGGYLKSTPGIRDAGFNAEEGQQFTINITKELDNGKLNFYTRQTDDHGVWYLPTPLNIDGVDNKYTQIGPLNRQATIQYGPDGTRESVDFGDGRGWDGAVSGGSISLDFDGGWSFVDRFNYTSGDADTYGLVPHGGPSTIAQVADNGLTAVGAVTGTEYAGDTPVQQIGRWVVRKHIQSFTNDMAVTKKWQSTKATFGLYTANFSANDWWSLGNQAYHVLRQGGELLTGIDCNDNLDSCDWNYDINSAGDGNTRAFYTAVEYTASEALTLDIGLRSERHEITYSVDEDLDGIITKSVDYDETDLAWTAGANYALSDNSGVFVRINSGSKMPYFDDFRDNFDAYSGGEDLIKEVSQFELGYKLALENLSVYATGFFNEVEGDTFVRRPGEPAEILTNEAYGIELDVNYAHDSGFSLNLNSTIQETEITESPDNQGNEAQRQPGWQVRLTPSYDLELDNGMWATLYGTVSAVDDRFANNANTVVLPGYEKVDLGVLLSVSENFTVRLSADNLTDENGLTEGDPRNPEAPNGRYILPRSFKLSVGYEF